MRSSLLAVAAVVALAVLVIVVNATWRDRAEDLCSERAPSGATISLEWKWSEAAYVCAYGTPEAEPRRIGIIDALHGDRGPQHPGR